jgi:hypothetical protein
MTTIKSRLADLNIDNLSAACIDAKPISFDWSEGYGEKWDIIQPDVSEWDYDRCIAWLDNEGYAYDSAENDYADALRDAIESWQEDMTDAERDATDVAAEMDTWTRGQLMEFTDKHGIDTADADESFRDALRDVVRETMDADPYYGVPMMSYAYPLDSRYDADAIADLPSTTVVTIDDEPYLALTGGGMDFSWEICESFIRLGYLPPVHFCDLPMMAGQPTEAGKVIIAACRKSCEVMKRWIDNRIETLDRLASK